MAIMQSLEVPSERVADVRKMIPAGVEHYVLKERSISYINMRTDDHALVRTLTDLARSPRLVV